jgi:hypothetical protein
MIKNKNRMKRGIWFSLNPILNLNPDPQRGVTDGPQARGYNVAIRSRLLFPVAGNPGVL